VNDISGDPLPDPHGELHESRQQELQRRRVSMVDGRHLQSFAVRPNKSDRARIAHGVRELAGHRGKHGFQVRARLGERTRQLNLQSLALHCRDLRADVAKHQHGADAATIRPEHRCGAPFSNNLGTVRPANAPACVYHGLAA
jgi:hypothetical protein